MSTKDVDYTKFTFYPRAGRHFNLPNYQWTAAEQLAVDNPTFRQLRQSVLPDYLLSASGLAYRNQPTLSKDISLEELPTLNALCDAVKASYEPYVAMLRLVRKVRETVDGLFERGEYKYPPKHISRLKQHGFKDEERDHNAQLLHDLVCWLSGDPDFEGFEWERRFYELRQDMVERRTDRDLDRFRQTGDSRLVLVFTNQLSPEDTVGVARRLIDHCVGLHNVELADPDSLAQYLATGEDRRELKADVGDINATWRWLPKPNCLGCDDKAHGSINDCQNVRLFPVVDCGALGEVKACIGDEWLSDQIDFRELALPRSYFRRYRSEAMRAPCLTVYDLRRLRNEARAEVTVRLKRCISHFDREKPAVGDQPTKTELVTTTEVPELAVVASTGFFSVSSGWEDFLDGKETKKDGLGAVGNRCSWFNRGLLVAGTH